jgi:hypothetical protein
MAETVTLEFIARQLDRVIADQAEMRDDIRVLTAIVLRHENMLASMKTEIHDILGQVRAMVSQHARFNDRLRRLEDQPAQ